MKRGLTIALTIALIGGLTFMGLAGTAAAQPSVDIAGGDGGNATNTAEVNQQNNNAQIGAAEANANGGSSDKHDHYKKSSSSTATAIVDQYQDVDQTNDAVVEQNAEGGDGGDGIDVDIEGRLPVILSQLLSQM